MKEKNVNTPYDDVFRTLLNDCPDLIIPVLNEAFGTSFIIGRDMVRKGDNKFFYKTGWSAEGDCIRFPYYGRWENVSY